MNRKRRENHEETLIRHPQNFHYQSFIISVWKYFCVLFKIRHDQPDVQISKKEKKNLFILHPLRITWNYHMYDSPIYKLQRKWMLFDRFVLIKSKETIQLFIF